MILEFRVIKKPQNLSANAGKLVHEANFVESLFVIVTYERENTNISTH